MQEPTCQYCYSNLIGIDIFEDDNSEIWVYDDHLKTFVGKDEQDNIVQNSDTSKIIRLITQLSDESVFILKDISYMVACVACGDECQIEYVGKNGYEAIILMLRDFLRDLTINNITECTS